MLSEELIFAATCDISGHVRGKAFPARDLPTRLLRGLGWTPTNIMISPLGPIWATPFGTVGDLMLLPDPSTEVRVDFADGSAVEHFILGDLRHTDGTAWECCPREFLRRAIAALGEEGYQLHTAFEQEFVYNGADAFAASPYSLGAFRQQGHFGAMLAGALRAAGLTPETFLAEYGQCQFEVTVAPADALAAADHAIITRELARAAAFRLGHRAIFSPMIDPGGTGNGVHIHMSLRGKDGEPITHEAGRPYNLSSPAVHFFAGILGHLPALCAVTAPSPVSYLRLTPNRWAPTQADIAVQDRAVSLRVCPAFGATGDESIRAQLTSNTGRPMRPRVPTWPWRRLFSRVWMDSGVSLNFHRMRRWLRNASRIPEGRLHARCHVRLMPLWMLWSKPQRHRRGSGRRISAPICKQSERKPSMPETSSRRCYARAMRRPINRDGPPGERSLSAATDRTADRLSTATAARSAASCSP